MTLSSYLRLFSVASVASVVKPFLSCAGLPRYGKAFFDSRKE